jgi:hypothetical protein
MNQRRKDGGRPFIPHHEAAEALQPRVRPFDDPPVPVPPQLPPILMRRPPVIAPRRNNRLDAPLDQQCPYSVAVVSAIRDQPLGPAAPGTASADAPVPQRRVQEFSLRGGSLLHMYSERSTRAIGQNHELCSLAPFSRPDQRTPFFAAMNMPSMKHSSQRTFFRSSSRSRKARHISSRTPDSAHSISLRWTVLLAPYRLGSSLHGAPVHKIQRTPSKHWRSSAGGRPPLFRLGRFGNCSRMSAHCFSVTARQAIGHLRDLVSYRTNTSCQLVSG